MRRLGLRRDPPAPPEFGRDAARARLAAREFDLVVVGGGITGCGVALDAAARGLRVALVEAEDFASGTSSRSSKLVHGGLRYLAQRDLSLVREALVERERLLRNAPHLVHPMRFVVPLFGRDGVLADGLVRGWSTALWGYDLVGGVRVGRRHRHIGAGDARRHVPLLRSDSLVSAFVYWDAQADDARLTLAVARTAAAHGAVVTNRAPAVGLLRRSGRIGGVRLGDGTEVRAAVVVNAAGVWCEEVERLAGVVPALRVRPAKGVHLTVPATRLPCDTAAVLPVPGGRDSVFVVPWRAPGEHGTGGAGRFTYIGTTDTDYAGPLRTPLCSAADVERLLAVVNHWTTANLAPGDVSGSWAGLRPLVDDPTRSEVAPADLSRRHAVVSSAPGLVAVTGGKLTTYRRMAADAVDAAVDALGRRPDPARRLVDRRRTAALALIGAGGPPAPPRAGGVLGVPSHRRHLFGRYGTEAAAVAELADADPRLAGPLVEGLGYLRAEAVFAARHEMAATVEDVLARRTRALLVDRDAAAAAAPAVAELLAAELGWDRHRVGQEVAAFGALVDAERAALRAGAGVA
jgi:glycerol-3-phosphate dehydrogenase